ncbi:MAG TPA: hypothetical protein VM802_14840 [Chitinophaga sp.]|uniref:hypothetical protein n=1 Tax=Chitinophaga sp. TaxID=1869181 RepID=UPI002CB009D6|nr:hypothetical protein [Chitinophaga sp.]HVI46149.1 hypothetical protein [Chitinophaga sp.]
MNLRQETISVGFLTSNTRPSGVGKVHSRKFNIFYVENWHFPAFFSTKNEGTSLY